VSTALVVYSALIAVGLAFVVMLILKVHARTKSKPNWWKDLGG
jgi:hypothetical protein